MRYGVMPISGDAGHLRPHSSTTLCGGNSCERDSHPSCSWLSLGKEVLRARGEDPRLEPEPFLIRWSGNIV